MDSGAWPLPLLFALFFLFLIYMDDGREDPWTLGNMEAILSTPISGQSYHDV